MTVLATAANHAQAALSIIDAFNRKTPGSKTRSAESRHVLADKSPIAMPFSHAVKEAYYPIVVERAQGAHLTDIDGNRYVDILMGLGTNLFGHNPDFVRDAIQERLEKGFPMGPQSEIAAETATLFCRLTGMDRVAFSNTGTEAVMAAIRIARCATGRDTIAIFTNSYHGHSDQVLNRASRLEYMRRGALTRTSGLLHRLRPVFERLMLTRAHPNFAGIPSSAARDVILLDYGNPRSLDILRRKAGRLAAVLVEPVQSRCPELQPAAFLQELRAITQQAGTALIFDETITGFRVHPGGAQAHFGIRADLVTYGKIAGGGLPLSLIGGTKRFMDHIDGGPWSFGDASGPQVRTTFFAGTYCRHPLALAAARATARHLLDQGRALQDTLNQRTAALVERLNDMTAAKEIPVRFTRFGSFFAIAMSESRITPDTINLLSFLLLTAGVHLRAGDRGGFLSTAHSDEDIAAVFDAFASGLSTLASLGLLERRERTVSA